ncbi:MAG: DUF6057 family protein [Dysgonamonadaceae bacterium]|jgi:hypothetical protein|nr:DUF6057 family protein [Dysgonamonadaceae bacterium]
MKFKPIYCWFVVCAVLFAFLQMEYEFHFYFVEQNQLFQNDLAFVSDMLRHSGGLADIAAGFLVQFFFYPFVGAAITALLLTVSGWLAHTIIKKIAPEAKLLVFCLLLVVSLLFVHLDYIYLVSGTIAFILSLIAVYLTFLFKKFELRIGAEVFFSLVLFFLAGSVYVLYSLAVILIEILFFKSGKRFFVMFLVLEVALIGWLGVKYAVCGEYRTVFLPDFYYNLLAEPETVLYFPWLSMPLLIVVARLTNRPFKRNMMISFVVIQLVIVGSFFWKGIPKYDWREMYEVKKFDWYSRSGQWDKILEQSKGKITYYRKLCYVNLALSECGELGDRMFAFEQRDPWGLISTWDKTTIISLLHSDITFSMDYIALSQEMAFEAYVSAMNGGNPRALKRLVQTNLIFGAYPVAEKYIRILENTLAYRDWAKSQRRFLYNDEAVENDSLLGAKKRSLPANSELSLRTDIETELQQIVENNPDSRSAFEYLVASRLLAKDLEKIKLLLDKYLELKNRSASSERLVLPRHLQEAICILNESEPSTWAGLGVSDETADRFIAFKQILLSNRNNPNALPAIMARQFGHTYWYFVAFK